MTQTGTELLLMQENQQLKQENNRLAGECAELKEFSDTIQVLHHDLTKENQRLREALKPFAQFACSPQGECDCNNCVARDLLAQNKEL